MTKKVRRGEIWLVNWNPGRSSEQRGFRPALIVQTYAANLNPNYPNTIVVAISTKGKPVPFHIIVEPSLGNGLKKRSHIKAEQLLTISKERLVKCIGLLEREVMFQVEESIKIVLELI
ncbi:type II toxin-antitoxin system PemK/MazF family toxin [Desulfothermus naphthae]